MEAGLFAWEVVVGAMDTGWPAKVTVWPLERVTGIWEEITWDTGSDFMENTGSDFMPYTGSDLIATGTGCCCCGCVCCCVCCCCCCC